MPIYEYECEECQNIFEEWQRNHECNEAACPECGGKAGRVISPTSFVLKGGGWYTTDYARKKPAANTKGPLTPPAVSGAGKEAAASSGPKNLAEKAASAATSGNAP